VSRRRGWIFFVVGLALALGTGVLVFIFLQRQAVIAEQQSRQAALEKYAPPPTMPIAVAARPLEAGTTLTPNDYVMKEFPLDLVPIQAITDTTKLDNQMLVRHVGQGETFQTAQFLGGQGSSISQQIKKGYVLFAFPIIDLMSQSNVLQEGDHIDLYITLPLKELGKGQDQPDKDLGKATALTLQNIEVFKILRSVKQQDDKEEGAPTALLCSVTPSDAVILKYAKDSGGTIDFALRSPADKDPFTTPWIDPLEFSRRYLLSQQ